ncbi:hypothetical protein M8C21_025708, partial [Ambrosia artemisiifolia]
FNLATLNTPSPSIKLQKLLHHSIVRSRLPSSSTSFVPEERQRDRKITLREEVEEPVMVDGERE